MKLKSFDGSSQYLINHFQHFEEFSRFVCRKVEQLQTKSIHVQRIQSLSDIVLLQPFDLFSQGPEPLMSYLGAVKSLNELRQQTDMQVDPLNHVLDAAVKEITGVEPKSMQPLDNLLSFQKTGLLQRYWDVREVKGMSSTVSDYNLLDPTKSEPFIIKHELKKWPWEVLEQQRPGTLKCYFTHPRGKIWLERQIKEQGVAAWDLVKSYYPFDGEEGNYSPYRSFSIDQILLLDESERLRFLKSPRAIVWLARRLQEVLQHERRNDIISLFPISNTENHYIYEHLQSSDLSYFPDEELLPFLRLPFSRKRFENDLTFRQLEDGNLFLRAYPSDSMDNFHLYNRPEALLSFDDEQLYTYLKSPSGKKMAENCPSDFFNHDRLQTALVAVYPPEDSSNLNIYLDYRETEETLYLTLHSKIVDFFPDELFPYWGMSQSLHVRFLDNPGIDVGGLRRDLVSRWMESVIKNSKKVHFSHYPLGAFPRELQPGKLTQDEVFNFQMLGEFFALAIRNGYLLGERFHPQWLSCLYEMLCWGRQVKPQYRLGQMDNPTLIAWVKENVPCEDSFAVQQLQYIESLLNAKEMDEIAPAIEFLNLLWESDTLDRAIRTKNLVLAKQETRRLWLEGLHGYLTLTHETAVGLNNSCPLSIDNTEVNNHSDWSFVSKEQLALSIQGKLAADWLKERFYVSGNDPHAVELVKNTVQEWLESHREDRIALKHLLLYLTGSAGISEIVHFELVEQQELIVVHTCSKLAHVKHDITREELLKELDLYASGHLTGFTIV